MGKDKIIIKEGIAMINRVEDLIKELEKLDPRKRIVVETPDGETYKIRKVSGITIIAKIIL